MNYDEIIWFKCPHCGKLFTASALSGRLIPAHGRGRGPCPGTLQTPRGISDRRPLWKDEKK